MGWKDAPEVGGWASAPEVDAPPANDKPELMQRMQNIAGGAVRGAGSIGATLLTPYDLLAGNTSSIGNPERRKAMDEALQSLGVDTKSLAFQVSKLGGEVAGTAGVGGALANLLGRFPALAQIPGVIEAIRTGGMAAPGANMGTRILGGAVTGGATAGLTNPEDAAQGAVFGGALPPAVHGAGVVGGWVGDKVKEGARGFMQSAVKPTLKQHQSGAAKTAIDTMLEKGISPNKKGVEKLQTLVDATDDRITDAIRNSTATVDKQTVAGTLGDTRAHFTRQVAPQSDLAAIQGVEDSFVSHPMFPTPMQRIPVQDAQDLKRGTYQVLKKKYGQLGSAETEAQKALARGLKDEIAAAVPGVGKDNAELSRLLDTLSVVERRALMEGNKNPGGLSLLAGNKAGLIAFLADRNAALKALSARGMYTAANQRPIGLLRLALEDPVLRTGLLATEAGP